MAKDSPYFKFYTSEFNDGDIQLCSLESIGLFSKICSLYWSRKGEMNLSKTQAKLKIKSSKYLKLIEELRNHNAIKLVKDNIKINFLDEQLKERGQKAVTNSKNGHLGGRPKSENNPVGFSSDSDLKANESNKEEKREEEKREEDNKKIEEETCAVDFDLVFKNAFDEITCESYMLAFKNINLGAELQKFRTKCDNDKIKYYGRDVGGLRTAFQYQLQNLRTLKNGTAKNQREEHLNSLKEDFANRVMQGNRS